MEIFIKIVYALFFMSCGYGIMRYRKVVHGWTGNWYWAEKYLGSGGTYIALLFIGLLLIFYGAIYPFGGLELLTSTK